MSKENAPAREGRRRLPEGGTVFALTMGLCASMVAIQWYLTRLPSVGLGSAEFMGPKEMFVLLSLAIVLWLSGLGLVLSRQRRTADQLQGLGVELERRLSQRALELGKAQAQVEQLHGLLPICCYCKRIRDDHNYWQQVEAYFTASSETRFSHGICPDCYARVVKPELERSAHRS